ncbi:unnamed protein product [Cyprideis torosa]|uniref:Uncharacterized protein n=1 Tax=Cyprideis torosa TaxID=163714 RepID=A0A7R8WZ83_9CRUS|nr:unnamed protein product [Cyprideis torosa]CAG0910264.1 unnamed protein product [Cyprideis torosa]
MKMEDEIRTPLLWRGLNGYVAGSAIGSSFVVVIFSAIYIMWYAIEEMPDCHGKCMTWLILCIVTTVAWFFVFISAILMAVGHYVDDSNAISYDSLRDLRSPGRCSGRTAQWILEEEMDLSASYV